LQAALSAPPKAPEAAKPAAPPPAPVEEPAEPPAAPPQKEISPLEALKVLARLPAERIALVLEGESSRTVSIILTFLDDDKAGQVFRFLPAPVRNEVSVQFSTQGMPSLDVLRRMALALVVKHQRLPEKSSFPEGPARYRKMADMLRQLEKPQRVQVLEALEKQAPGAANEVKSLMYRFEDALRIENRSMQKVLVELENRTLAVALTGAADDIRDKFLANLSKRAQENLREEMELLRAPPKEEIDQARAEITAVIQRLDLAGELTMMP
jgi:flagellar motor switch protein FliG